MNETSYLQADERLRKQDETIDLRLDSLGASLRHDRLQVLPTCRTGPHSVSNGSREGSEVGEVRVDMNRVEVLGDVRVALVREGSRECSGGRVGHGISIVWKVGDGALGGSMALNVCDDWVSVTVLLLKVDIANLDEPLDLITNVYIPRNGDRVIGSLVLECDLGLQTENERGACCKGFRLIAQFEPLLREENANGSIGWVFNHVVWLLENLEGVFIVRETAAVEEGRGDLNDGFSFVDDVADNLNGLAGISIDNGRNLRFGLNDVANVEG